ncbi:hypothetical protein MNBD_GAMMA21-2096 [hydrothermal vent metagenome]|uniref:Uncharacterized protein n=1 Tax=hydrothermal vent metagenome TaxID=652676 RepID=A0A3B0ZCE1_9ZZZZ
MLEPELQSIVEQLCSDGCLQVNVYIQEIEAKDLPEVMLVLSEQQQNRVLAELKSIMAVYDQCEV